MMPRHIALLMSDLYVNVQMKFIPVVLGNEPGQPSQLDQEERISSAADGY